MQSGGRQRSLHWRYVDCAGQRMRGWAGRPLQAGFSLIYAQFRPRSRAIVVFDPIPGLVYDWQPDAGDAIAGHVNLLMAGFVVW